MALAIFVWIADFPNLPVNDRIHDPGDVGPDNDVLALFAQQIDGGDGLAYAHVLSHHVQRHVGIRPAIKDDILKKFSARCKVKSS